ncbi:MAG TPA: hypothetical protein VMH28_20380 [Candidatus Acidoferrales bacterium]|nr:hypothetical protein [Candidatus Acidoferrales bacterium]
MRHVLHRHLFLSIGVLSLALFFVVAGLDGAGKTNLAQILGGPMRLLIIPIYLVWMLIAILQVAIAGPEGLPQPFAMLMWIFSMVAGLTPYALLDYLLHCLRRRALRR